MASLRNTFSTRSSIGFRGRTLENRALGEEVQDLRGRVPEGFSTVQELLAEAERIEALAFANLDIDLLDEFVALSERLDMATAAAGLPDVGELFGPFPLLNAQEESEIAAQSNLDFIGEWANRNGIQVFDGRLGSPTMTRAP